MNRHTEGVFSGRRDVIGSASLHRANSEASGGVIDATSRGGRLQRRLAVCEQQGAFHPRRHTPWATAGPARAIWPCDLARGQAVARLPEHTSYVSSLAFSPDGARWRLAPVTFLLCDRQLESSSGGQGRILRIALPTRASLEGFIRHD
jgi:hypothetical protein